MFIGESSPRPVPSARNLITLDELVSLRFWPPARGQKRERMAIREGHHLSNVRARGMEYDDVREYQPGDDIRHLDWRLMARTGEAHTKLFREERERPVFVITDLRAPMHFATQGHFKSVLASYAAAMVIWTTLSSGDRVGGQILTAQENNLFKPSSNRQQVMQMIAALSGSFGQSEELETTQPAVSLADKLIEVEALLSSGTILYLFSDFHDADPILEQHLMRLSQRCELKLVLISDPLESQLPTGNLYRFTGGGRELMVDADRNQQIRYRTEFQKRITLLEQLHNIRGVEFAHWQSHAHPLFSQPEAGDGL
ncbi:MAG: DUF58 domain-containing protein [Neptuniibacter sp.]